MSRTGPPNEGQALIFLLVHFSTSQPATMGANTGETLQERSKGKDVRTSNIVAAKVRSLGSGDRYLWYSCVAVSRLGGWTHCPPLALSNFWPVGRAIGAVWMRAGLAAGTGDLPPCRCGTAHYSLLVYWLVSLVRYLTSVSLSSTPQ